jgi:hypothetical protein
MAVADARQMLDHLGDVAVGQATDVIRGGDVDEGVDVTADHQRVRNVGVLSPREQPVARRQVSTVCMSAGPSGCAGSRRG